jgi:hypothetical protein
MERLRTLRVPSRRFAAPLDEELFFPGLRLVGQFRSFKGVVHRDSGGRRSWP